MIVSLLLVLKDLSLLVLVIYGASQFKFFYQLFLPTSRNQATPYLALFFGLLGLLGAVLTFPIAGKEISLDFFPIIIGGLAAGPLVGLGAAMITAAPYFLRSDYLYRLDCTMLILTGVISGLLAPSFEVWAMMDGYSSRISNFLSNKFTEPLAPGSFSKITIYFLLSAISIGLKTSLLPLFYGISPGFNTPLFLWQISTTFISVTVGIILTMQIIENLLSKEEYILARQAHKTLRIADETLPHLRDGLNAESASTTANVILEIAKASAVAITDSKNILAYEGLGADHHRVGGALLTRATKDVLTSGELKVIRDRKEIGCPFPGCPLSSAIIIPLKGRDKTIGTLKLYLGGDRELSSHFINLASGLGRILSIQIELAEVARLEQLNTQAELKSLQAQINPHFLFNTLNTIASFYRSKPETARELLVKFADFFRRSFNKPKEFVTLEEEMEYVEAYLMFEKARFGDRLRVVKDIAAGSYASLLPALILQPIVENAVKHGTSAKDDTCSILIKAQRVNGELELFVEDNGMGISPQDLKKIFVMGYGQGNGMGLSNVNERLKAIYGENFSVKIYSRPHKGTTVSLKIPQRLN